jgi:hypothetical protein
MATQSAQGLPSQSSVNLGAVNGVVQGKHEPLFAHRGHWFQHGQVRANSPVDHGQGAVQQVAEIGLVALQQRLRREVAVTA